MQILYNSHHNTSMCVYGRTFFDALICDFLRQEEKEWSRKKGGERWKLRCDLLRHESSIFPSFILPSFILLFLLPFLLVLPPSYLPPCDLPTCESKLEVSTQDVVLVYVCVTCSTVCRKVTNAIERKE
jgi:hypothetical protein